MPKDNEVDEKVEDFFERLYGMTFRLFLDPNSEEDEGNTVELRLGATVDNLALFETQDHAVLHTAATVAELRAEVERLREANQLYSFAMNTAGIDELKRRADAAERRVVELEAAAFAARGRLNYLNSLTGEKIDADIIDKINAALTGADPT